MYTCTFQVTNCTTVTWYTISKTINNPSAVFARSYLVLIQSLPWLLDEDTQVNDTHTTQRVRLGRHLQGGFLSWYGWGWRKLQGHLTHTITCIHTYTFEHRHTSSNMDSIYRCWKVCLDFLHSVPKNISHDHVCLWIQLPPQWNHCETSGLSIRPNW